PHRLGLDSDRGPDHQHLQEARPLDHPRKQHRANHRLGGRVGGRRGDLHPAAMIFLGFPLEYSRIFLLAMIGGWLGILFMIPLRRYLIVQEHGVLPYPEGAACADVLQAGEKGGNFAGRVFWGLAVGGVYKFLMDALGFWKGTAAWNPKFLPGASLRADVTPE